VVESLVKLIYGLWPESVSNLGSGEANSDYPQLNVTVVADVGQLFKTWNCFPRVGIKELGDLIGHASRLNP
jgi:hypothetical protein